jgi:BMFP domain-containing protein YqiC
MENTKKLLELVNKEIIEIQESIVYHTNKLTILEMKLEDLKHRQNKLTIYLTSDND